MKVKLGPHGIIVEKREDVQRKLESGIIIPSMVKEVKPTGKVMAVGSGTKEEPMGVEIGDIVTYQSIGAREVMIEDKEYLLISSDNGIWINL